VRHGNKGVGKCPNVHSGSSLVPLASTDDPDDLQPHTQPQKQQFIVSSI